MSRYREKRRFFDETAPLWEHGRFDEKERPVAEWILREAGVRPGMTVLEPGCGAGRMTRLLARAVGPAGRVIAADISARMAAAARRNVPDEHVEVHHQAVEQLHLPERSVDLVLCFDVFPHFEEPGEVLERFRSLLKPTGTVVVAHCPGRNAVNALHRRVGGAVGADHLPDEPGMRALFEAHGFHIVRLVDEAEVYFLEAALAGRTA